MRLPEQICPLLATEISDNRRVELDTDSVEQRISIARNQQIKMRSIDSPIQLNETSFDRSMISPDSVSCSTRGKTAKANPL
jgi:hypothetical protein